MHSLVASVLLYSVCVVVSCAEAVYSRNVSYYVECMANSFPPVWITRMHFRHNSGKCTSNYVYACLKHSASCKNRKSHMHAVFAENGTRYLSCQCSATELQQLDNNHPSQSSLMSYTGDSKCLSCTHCSHTVCDVKTLLRVYKKLLDLFYNLALMRAILYFGFVVVVVVLPVCTFKMSV